MMASKFIMLIDQAYYGAFTSGPLKEYLHLDAKMRDFCRRRKAPTLEERKEHFADESYPPYCPHGTEARVTVDNSPEYFTTVQTIHSFINVLVG